VHYACRLHSGFGGNHRRWRYLHYGYYLRRHCKGLHGNTCILGITCLALADHTYFSRESFALKVGTTCTENDNEIVSNSVVALQIGVFFGGLAALLICVFFAARSGSSGAGEPTLTPKGRQQRSASIIN
jgi:hypothetical protein